MTFTRSTFTSVFKQGTRNEKSRDCKLQSFFMNPWHTPLPRTVAVALFLFTPRDYLAARQKVLAHWLSFKKASF